MPTDLLPTILTVEMMVEQEPIIRRVLAAADSDKKRVFEEELASLVMKYGEFGTQWGDLLKESLFDERD